MLAEPILIRRPLIAANGRFEVGFEPAVIESWLGLTNKLQNILEASTKVNVTNPCPQPASA